MEYYSTIKSNKFESVVVRWMNLEPLIQSEVNQKDTYHISFSSVAQSCPTLCDPMNRSMPGLPVHHQLPEFTQTHVHRVSDAIQPSHPLSSHCPPPPNPSQHQSLLQWVNSSHEIWPSNPTPRHIPWGNQNWKTHVSQCSLQHYLQ